MKSNFKLQNLTFLATSFALAASLFGAAPAHADIGLLLFESFGGMAEVAGQGGHNAYYLSDICPDDSPVKMRFCKEDEEPSVLSRNDKIQGYDWTITPFSIYMSGVSRPEQAPLIATKKLKAVLENYSLDKFISHDARFSRKADGTRPDGDWTYTAGMGVMRDVYNIHIKMTREQEEKIVEEFNDPKTVWGANVSHFSLLKNNCANFDMDFINEFLPAKDHIKKGLHSMGMATPKGNAMALLRSLAKKAPELEIWVEKYPQVPGLFSRSHDNLFPSEELEKNRFIAPILGFFFPKILVASFLWNDVGTGFFGMDRSYRGRPSEKSGELAAKILADQQSLKDINEMSDRYDVKAEIKDLKQQQKEENKEVLGTSREWKNLKARFDSRVAEEVDSGNLAPFAVDILTHKMGFKQKLKHAWVPNRLHELSQSIILFLEANGSYLTTDEGATITLQVPGESAPRVSGLSAPQLASSDHSVAFLVWTAAMAEHLAVRNHNHETIGQAETEFEQIN